MNQKKRIVDNLRRKVLRIIYGRKNANVWLKRKNNTPRVPSITTVIQIEKKKEN